MSELGKEPESPTGVDSQESAAPKNQMVALLTLLPVLGILWLTMQYLPKFGDWMGEKADSVVSAVSGEESAGAPAKDSQGSPAEGGADETGLKPSPKVSPVVKVASGTAEFKSQIIEQLGGIDKVEVRHLAVSDDGERIVAALKLGDGPAGGSLIEVFFDRDEFGRFISTEDSPVSERLVLWGE
ncbi:MAG: hypothetical protein P1U86_18090 [Verrucomicrobiales bacterium]|nr:hypothetical protein [Verrucomicrobiales bacterium]